MHSQVSFSFILSSGDDVGAAIADSWLVTEARAVKRVRGMFTGDFTETHGRLYDVQ